MQCRVGAGGPGASYSNGEVRIVGVLQSRQLLETSGSQGSRLANAKLTCRGSLQTASWCGWRHVSGARCLRWPAHQR